MTRRPPWRTGPLLWIVGLVGALAMLLVVTLPPASSPPGDRSSFANGPAGTLALARLLTASGDRVERLTGRGFAAALPPAGAVVEAGPSRPFTPGQRAAMVGYLRAGGTVLYATAVAAVDRPLLASLGVDLGPRVRAAAARPLLPIVAAGAGAIDVGRARRLAAATPGVLSLLAAPAGVVGVADPIGRGHLYVLGSTRPLDNAGLRRGGDAALVLGLLARARNRRVVVDEIHHGYVDRPGRGAAALLFGTPLGAALVLVLLAGLVYGATAGRRLGRPLPPPERAIVRSTTDHLEAMAGLYARTRDRGAVAGRVRAQLEAVVRAVTGSAPGAADEAVAPALWALQPQAAPAVLDTLRSLAACERAPCPPGRLLELAQRADALARLLGGPRAAEPCGVGVGHPQGWGGPAAGPA